MTSKIDLIFGSLKALVVELLIIVFTVFLNFFASPYYQMIIVSWLLVMSFVMLISLTLYIKKMRYREHEEMLEYAVDSMSRHIVEIIMHGWQEGWKPEPENLVREIEQDEAIREIWVLTPDFKAVMGCKKGLVKENACRGTAYRFIYTEEYHRRYDELVGTCKSHDIDSAGNIHGRCLLGRRITPIEVVICRKQKHEDSIVYFHYDHGPEDRRVLRIVSWKYVGDLVSAFEHLWDLLAKLPHNPIGTLIVR